MQAYLAKHYGTEKKKKKKGQTLKKGNVGIVDESEFDWNRGIEEEEDDEYAPVVEENVKIREEKVPRADAWEMIREAALENERKREEEGEELEENQPVVVNEGKPRGGLQYYEEARAENERLQMEQLSRMQELDPDETGRDAETVHRDKSGRKVDLAAKRAEEARARREQMEREEKKMEWGKGLVQRQEQEDRKRRELEEQHKPLARYADDKELNEELKERTLWNDPAAFFLTSASKKKSKGPKRPTYQGHWPPNRFNIPPGYRWDGVDRSNGFEKEYFLRQNSRTALKAEAYAWSAEDM